jgi:hypothetical protein
MEKRKPIDADGTRAWLVTELDKDKCRVGASTSASCAWLVTELDKDKWLFGKRSDAGDTVRIEKVVPSFLKRAVAPNLWRGIRLQVGDKILICRRPDKYELLGHDLRFVLKLEDNSLVTGLSKCPDYNSEFEKNPHRIADCLSYVEKEKDHPLVQGFLAVVVPQKKPATR